MAIGAVWKKWDRWFSKRREQRDLEDFSCGHCSRNASCGRAPGDDCIEKHNQISQGDDWRYRPVADQHRATIPWSFI